VPYEPELDRMTSPSRLEATVRKEIRSVFLALGFDIEDRDEVVKLREALHWLCDFKENRRESTNTHIVAFWTSLSATVGAISGSVVSWLLSNHFIGH
jgi:hypothetical protein